MALRELLFGTLVLVAAAAPAASQSDHVPDCAGDYSVPHVDLPNGHPFDVQRAIALFRFNRRDDALRELDASRAVVRGRWRWRVPPDVRKEITAALDSLRACLATATAPELAALTVRVTGFDPAAPGPQPGARVFVQGILVGRTGRDGTLTARVPSGSIEVWAEVPISYANFTGITLAPGESSSLEIALSEGKEIDEHTTLTLAEAVDDIVPVTARSLTLKFMDGRRFAPVARVETVALVDRHGGFLEELTAHFRVVRGEIVAKDADRLFKVLAPRFAETIHLQVHAMASETAMHDATIAFRVGQWPLSVTLEPPPSNPALRVSRIEVGISLPGAGIAVQRVSDAKGRFEVPALPSGPVVFECATVSNGRYYYCDAMLVHSGPRSARLVLRNVEDVKKGVAPLRVNGR